MEQNIRITIGDTMHSVVRDAGIPALGYRWEANTMMIYGQDWTVSVEFTEEDLLIPQMVRQRLIEAFLEHYQHKVGSVAGD